MRLSTRRALAPLASVGLALALLVGTGSTASAATLIGEWKLKGSFGNATGTNVKLEAIGLPEFQSTNVAGTVRKALKFELGEGVKLTRVPRAARSSYSIQIQFELDDANGHRRLLTCGPSLDVTALYGNSGYLSIWDFSEDTSAVLDSNEWNRLLITRDGRSGLVRVYVNGRLRLAYADYPGEFKLREGIGQLFSDNGGWAGAGTLANVRIWRGVVSP